MLPGTLPGGVGASIYNYKRASPVRAFVRLGLADDEKPEHARPFDALTRLSGRNATAIRFLGHEGSFETRDETVANAHGVTCFERSGLLHGITSKVLPDPSGRRSPWHSCRRRRRRGCRVECRMG